MFVVGRPLCDVADLIGRGERVSQARPDLHFRISFEMRVRIVVVGEEAVEESGLLRKVGVGRRQVGSVVGYFVRRSDSIRTRYIKINFSSLLVLNNVM